MFAIFKDKKQVSEKVSTIELAYRLFRMHKSQSANSKLEIKANVKRQNKDGMIVTSKKGKDSFQWVSIDEYEKRLNKIESEGWLKL